MIRVKELSLSHILKSIDLTFEAGKTHVIIGPNGAGKTTLLEILTKNILQYSGQVMIGSESLRDVSAQDLARRMTYIPQFLEWNGEFTVEDYFSFSRFPFSYTLTSYTPEEVVLLNEIVEGLELSSFMGRKLCELSGGEQKRLAIGASLFQETDYVILDEPLAALDPVYKKLVCDFLKSWQQKRQTTYIMTIHDLFWADEVGDKFFALKKGELIQNEGQIFSQDFLESLYDLPFDIYHSEEGKKVYMPKGGRYES